MARVYASTSSLGLIDPMLSPGQAARVYAQRSSGSVKKPGAAMRPMATASASQVSYTG